MYALFRILSFDGIENICVATMGVIHFSVCGFLPHTFYLQRRKTMRKIVSIVILLAMVLTMTVSFAACDSAPQDRTDTTTNPESITVAPENLEATSNLAYTQQPNGTYSVSQGSAMESTTDIVIPATYNGIAVTKIADEAFADCETLSSIVIPESVTDIGNHAFDGCSALSSVVIPDSVVKIGVMAFCGCSDLTSVIIPDSVTSIGETAFWGCRSLTSITIPDSVTSIGVWPFAYCTSLTSILVDENNPSFCSIEGILYTKNASTLICFPAGKNKITIPDGVTSIGNEAFRGCAGLISIVMPDSITNIGEKAFYGCSGLTSIDIPDSIKSIDDKAFHDCSGLTSIDIPDSVTIIGRSAFSSCSSLTSIIIPDSITIIDIDAFYYCSSLTDLYYIGTEDEWNAIEKGNNWDSNTGSYTIHYNYVPD